MAIIKGTTGYFDAFRAGSPSYVSPYLKNSHTDTAVKQKPFVDEGSDTTFYSGESDILVGGETDRGDLLIAGDGIDFVVGDGMDSGPFHEQRTITGISDVLRIGLRLPTIDGLLQELEKKGLLEHLPLVTAGLSVVSPGAAAGLAGGVSLIGGLREMMEGDVEMLAKGGGDDEVTSPDGIRAGTPAVVEEEEGGLSGTGREGFPLKGGEEAVSRGSSGAKGALVKAAPETDFQKLAVQLGHPTVNLDEVEPDNAALDIIPLDRARQYKVLPLKLNGRELVLAASLPPEVEGDIRFMLGERYTVTYVMAEEEAVLAAIERYYGKDWKSAAQQVGEVLNRPPPEVVDIQSEIAASEDSGVVQFVNGMLANAVRARATDIHFETNPDGTLRVRFRRDKKMEDIILGAKEGQAVISRIKVMANLKIDEKRLPQDGRLMVKIGGKQYEFRVSTMSTLFGERVVLRLFNTAGPVMTLDDLGFMPNDLALFREAIHGSQRLVLVTGPTGSGKTTTLAAALQELNKPDVTILTVEDPVEIVIPGVSQSQINEAAGITFSGQIRAFLRQNPDIIMVGEIRDFDTAENAFKAAATGHLVLSTLHTTSAIKTVDRLADMGIERYNVADYLAAVVAQRLVPVICPKCQKKEIKTPSIGYLVGLGFGEEDARSLQLFVPTGKDKKGKCPYCEGKGFYGLAAIYEVLKFTPEIRAAYKAGEPSEEILAIAKKGGMTTLRQAGLQKVKDGVTTLDEVLFVTTSD